ncbi:MAG TPA: hypothetical protein VIJ50_08125 [Solirubrobacteraceae bacterium]
MSIWRRAPREVYRVYGEDQYLEGQAAPEGEATPHEQESTVEPDNRGVGPWTTAAWEAPYVSNGDPGSSFARQGGTHAGRVIGVGLLVGVGLATLALVFLNLSHRHRGHPALVGRGAGVETDRQVARSAHSASRSVSPPRFSTPSAIAPERRPRSRLNDDAPPASDSDPDPRAQPARLLASRPSGNVEPESLAGKSSGAAPLEPPVADPAGPSAPDGVETSTQVSSEPCAQDEFGFEQ